MTESLYDLLEPHLQTSLLPSRQEHSVPTSLLAATKTYLAQLTSTHLADLATTEPQSLAQELDRNDLSLRTLASRSHRAVINSSDRLSTLHNLLPAVASAAKGLKDAIPQLDEQTLRFSTTYSKVTNENKILDRRKRATQLSRNVDKISDILELPTLLSSVISSASTNASTSGTNFSTALDLFAHIKRLSILHPDSAIVKSVLAEAEEVMKEMTTSLITSLRGQNIRLAAAIRTIGWLRRIAPELSTPTTTTTTAKSGTAYTSSQSPTTDEGLFGTLFLTARLANLVNMLEALSPLRDLADQETARRISQSQSQSAAPQKEATQPIRKPSSSGLYNTNPSAGQQTERYLKRYIEIFREQSFATVSMYRNIFPSPDPSTTTYTMTPTNASPLLPLPPAISTYPLHLVDLLTSTLKSYLPNITDHSVRESLLTQVLYAAGSLGRLGADFSMVIALLDDDDSEDGGDGIPESEADAVASKTDRGTDAGQVTGTGIDSAHSSNVQRQQEAVQEQEHQHDEVRPEQIPEWVSVMQKHRVQAGRLEALAAGQDQAGIRRTSSETVVK